MDKVILAVGRRKTSTARVVVTPGTGKFRVNGKDVNEYFNVKTLLPEVFKPVEITNLKDKVDIRANVDGGGFRGQADAIKLGIARALVKMDETLRPTLKSEGLLSRDDREKERKKYGLHSARKDRQYRKR
jgi:small subunit ribosomal protein S9